MLQLKNSRKVFWFALFLWLVVLYSPAVNSPYLLDDLHTLPENPVVHSLSGIAKAWTSGKAYSSLPSNYGYRPVTIVVSTLLWSAGDGATWPFHLFKIVLLWAICYFIFELWLVLFGSPNSQSALLSTYAAILIYAVNPVHTQAVTYIAATASQLAAFFSLLCVLSYVRFRTHTRRTDLLLSLVFLTAAILSKEEGVAAFAFVVLVEIYLRATKPFPKSVVASNSSRFESSSILFLHALVAAGSVALIFWMYEPTQTIVRSEITRHDYFLTQLRAYIRYIEMYVAAFDLNFDNLQFGFSHSIFEPSVVLALTLNCVVVAVAVFKIRTAPWIALSLAWFYAGLAPASSLVVLSEPVNDHRAVLASIGLSFLTFMFLSWLVRKNVRAFYAVSMVLICGYSIMTFHRSFFWVDAQTVWAETVRKNPESPRALNNLAFENIKKSEFKSAKPLLDKCIQIKPTYANCYLNRGVANVKLGLEEEALKDFETGVTLDQTVVMSRLTLARHLIARGYFERPRDLLREADRFVAGHDLETRLALIDLFSTNGDRNEAVRLSRESHSVFAGDARFDQQSRLLESSKP